MWASRSPLSIRNHLRVNKLSARKGVTSMSTLRSISDHGRFANQLDQPRPRLAVWITASLAGLSIAWPLLCVALLHGPKTIIRSLTGDSYHYLAIARKAGIS